MRNSGPGPTVPVKNHGTRAECANGPDIVARSSSNSSEIGVRSPSLIAFRRIRSAGGTANLFTPVGTIPVTNRSERLVSKNTFPLTHYPYVVSGSPRHCGKPFSAQATMYSHGNNTPCIPVPMHGKWCSAGTAHGPNVVSGYCGDTGELIGPTCDIRTCHLAPTGAIPMEDERL